MGEGRSEDGKRVKGGDRIHGRYGAEGQGWGGYGGLAGEIVERGCRARRTQAKIQPRAGPLQVGLLLWETETRRRY